MTRVTTALVDHLQARVANVVHAHSGSVRTVEAEQVASLQADLRDAYALGLAATSGHRVRDMILAGRGDRDAIEREQLRDMLVTQVRDLEHFEGLLPRRVATDGETGYGPAPLIREVARPWSANLNGGRPVIPGPVNGGPWASVDPDLPVPAGDPMQILDVAEVDARHMSILVLDSAMQVADFIASEASGASDASALLQQISFDEVDRAAEEFVAGELVDAAGGTRAAGADLGAALDDAESAAGARGPVELAIVSAVDLPVVRRALAPTFFDGPHPALYSSAGQPAGTVTFVGRGGMLLASNDYQLVEAVDVSRLARSAAVGRPFLLQIRDDAVIQTVTGIGA